MKQPRLCHTAFLEDGIMTSSLVGLSLFLSPAFPVSFMGFMTHFAQNELSALTLACEI